MPEKLKQYIDRYFAFVLGFVFVLLTLLAWSNRFIQDDAFISYRYAANFADGHGLVWNIGERVEGYTNFLWTLIVSIPFFLRTDPVGFSHLVGLVCFILTLAVTYRISLSFSGSRYRALLAVVLLGTNFSFSAYATGGMETQLQTLLFTCAAWLGLSFLDERPWRPLAALFLSLVLSAALLTRLDSAIPAAVLATAVLFAAIRRKNLKRDASSLLMLFLPMILIVGGWLIWKMGYYGGVIPNTFYAKVSSSTSYTRGLFYLYAFLVVYLLAPFIFIAFSHTAGMMKKYRLGMTAVLAILVLWLLYVIRVGGDFMEFRFLVPVLPLFFVFFTELVCSTVDHRAMQTALVIMVFCGSLIHATGFDTPMIGPDIERTRQLESHLTEPDQNWIGIGKKLGELFGGSDVVIATTAAGAIPYFSKLQTIDMFGLNDPWVARNGAIVSSRPGHQRATTLKYLIDRKVTIIIGHPRVRPIGQATPPSCSFGSFFILDAKPEYYGEIPQNFRIIEIPIDDSYKLVALYFFQNPAVDRCIERNQITPVNLQYVSE